MNNILNGVVKKVSYKGDCKDYKGNCIDCPFYCQEVLCDYAYTNRHLCYNFAEVIEMIEMQIENSKKYIDFDGE